MKKGILYLVPTPIGNLGDITYRAVEVLKSVDLIAAEDTRTSLKLLNQYDIKNKMTSYHKFNESKQTKALLELLEQGNNIALITDAGTPGISDPASVIVKAAISKDIMVTCLPGATALIPALAASGLDTDSFTFVGFLPPKKKDRTALLISLKELIHTVILYESSHHITETLQELQSYFPERKFVLARELSKLYESFYRCSFADLSCLNELETRGEFVLMIEGKIQTEITDEQLTVTIIEKLKKNMSVKKLVEVVSAETGASKNRIYRLALAHRIK